MKGPSRRTDLRTGIVIKARKNMRRTRLNLHSIGYRHARHLESNLKVRGAVVDARKNVTMKIDHEPYLR